MLLIAFGVGVVLLGRVIVGYAGYGVPLGSFDNFKGNYFPEYLSSSEIPLYGGEPGSDKIPLYENNAEIVKINPRFTSAACLDFESCVSGIVTGIIDGDTIKVNSNSVMLALASAPELDEYGGKSSKKLIQVLCPVGSEVIVDQDDLQTFDKYGRIIGMVNCNGVNLDEELIESKYGYLSAQFCDSSEFSAQKWAQDSGCKLKTNSLQKIPELKTQLSADSITCDPSSTDFCIISPHSDLNCNDVSQKRFMVLQPDPHRFDGDKDGIDYES